MSFQKEIFLECECCVHGIQVEANTGWLNDNEVCMSFWYRGKYGTSFWERLKTAWHVLNGSRYMFDSVVLKEEKVQKLKQILEEALTDIKEH